MEDDGIMAVLAYWRLLVFGTGEAIYVSDFAGYTGHVSGEAINRLQALATDPKLASKFGFTVYGPLMTDVQRCTIRTMDHRLSNEWVCLGWWLQMRRVRWKPPNEVLALGDYLVALRKQVSWRKTDWRRADVRIDRVIAAHPDRFSVLLQRDAKKRHKPRRSGRTRGRLVVARACSMASVL